MIITYHGVGMVKLQVGETVVAVNPIGKDGNGKSPRFGADLALVSIPDASWNGVENMSYGEREPFVVEGPGEYEVGGIFVRGAATTGPEGAINTIYSFSLDNINVCHLGALASDNLSPEALEAMGVVDILFVPVGAYGTLNAKLADKVVNLLSPKLVIPIAYENQSELQNFLKEIGETTPLTTDKLTIKRRDLDGKEGEVAVVTTS